MRKDGHGCPVPLQTVGCGLPLHWIFEDVTACFGELLAVPEDPLVIVALPNGERWSVQVPAREIRHSLFVRSNNAWYRANSRTLKALKRTL